MPCGKKPQIPAKRFTSGPSDSSFGLLTRGRLFIWSDRHSHSLISGPPQVPRAVLKSFQKKTALEVSVPRFYFPSGDP